MMTARPKILFVDDEVSILSGLRRALRGKAQDWDMQFLADPIEALTFVQEEKPRVAVLDIRMPKMSGIELARAIHESQPGTVCLILSGSTEFDLALESINTGQVYRYYVKPCETADLIDGIESALSRRGRRSSDSGAAQIDQPVDFKPSGTLDLLPYGLIVAREDGHALFTNAAAMELMGTSKLIRLDLDGNCLSVTPPLTQRLLGAIAVACQQDRTTALSLDNDLDEPLHITVEPYRERADGTAPLACLFLARDTDSRAPSPALLVDMFGLTISESRLAAALAKGLSVEEAAQECGITKSSARTYLKNIFSKLGVSRQAELVRKLLLASAGGMGR